MSIIVATEHVDAVVIGAGPAGLAAASVVGSRGLSVRLIDEQVGPGGQIHRNLQPWQSVPEVCYSPASTVIDVIADDDASRTIRISWLASDGQRRTFRHTDAHALILATGAMERPVAFPGCELPGVMGVGAVQTILKQGQLVPDGPGVVLAGQGPLLLLTLQQVLARGGRVDTVLDLARPGSIRRTAAWLPSAVLADSGLLVQGAALWRSLQRSGVPVVKNISALQADGHNHLEAISYAADGQQREIPARLLAVHDGILPTTQLSRLIGLHHRWVDTQKAFVPVTDRLGASSHPRIWTAGDGAGIAGADIATLRGRLTGMAVAFALQKSSTGTDYAARMNTLHRHLQRRLPARHLVDRLFEPLEVDRFANDTTIICRCEAVTLGNIRTAIARGATGPNRVKTYTRCGMGACQGRQCSNALTRIVAAGTGRPPDAVGALRIRPPLKPVLISDYLGLEPGA